MVVGTTIPQWVVTEETAWICEWCLKWGAVLHDGVLTLEDPVLSAGRRCQREMPPDVDGVCRGSNAICREMASEGDAPPTCTVSVGDPIPS